MRRPVERAEEGARGDDGVAASQFAAAHAGGDERPDAALVAIALGDDERAQAGGQRVDLEVRRRSFDAVDQAQDVRHGQRVQPRPEGGAAGPRRAQREQQPVQRAILAEEQDLVLAAEVVVQVARGQVGGEGDLAHAGGGEAADPEDARRGAQDVQAAGVGAPAGAGGAAARTR
jgi:hypothetical protein